MDADTGLTVLHTKFTTYLPWSQPFLYDFLTAVNRHVRSVIVCTCTENLDRFPFPYIVKIPTPCLMHPGHGLLAAAYLRRSWRPGVIHAHFGFSGIHSLLLKQLLNAPLVVTFGGRDATTQMTMPRLQPLYELLLASADRIIAVSAELRDQLVAAGARSDVVDVIRRGTDLGKFTEVNREHRPGEAPVTLLMVGRIVEKKGHRWVLDAVARLVKTGVRLRLVIVGDGALASDMRRLAQSLSLSDIVEFTGALEHAQVREQMVAADVLVHCSVTGHDGDREGVPNAVVEAAATGLPIVGTRHGGVVEAVKDGETGLLVEERDIEALSGALQRMIASAPLRRQMGRAARHFVRAEFDAGRQVMRHVDLYRSLASETRPSKVWYPPDFARRLARSMSDSRHANEYPMLELFEYLRQGGHFRFRAPKNGVPSETAVEQLQRYGSTTSPRFKKLLRGSLAALIRYREQFGLGLGSRQVDALDRLALDFLRAGGDVSQVDASWDLDALEAFLHAAPDSRANAPA